jgi:hypothetical protein
MNTHYQRRQDMVTSASRGAADLMSVLLVLLLLGFAFAASNRDQPHLPPQGAVRPPLSIEEAPSLHEATKPRVLPKRTEDWLDRREINGPEIHP